MSLQRALWAKRTATRSLLSHFLVIFYDSGELRILCFYPNYELDEEISVKAVTRFVSGL